MTWASDGERSAGYASVETLKNNSFSGLHDYVSSDGAQDPQAVATAITTLIEAAPGALPLRTVVDAFGEGIRRINETAAAVQREVMESAGLGALVK